MSEAIANTASVQLTFSDDDRVATITLNRPQRRNALDDASWVLFRNACLMAEKNTRLRVLVLQAEGGHFCAGADVRELAEHITDPTWMRANQANVGAALDAYAAITVPTIAVVEGSCFGGGMALAASSDFVYAHTNACFAITPAKLGLNYRLVDCLRVVDTVGARRARELLLAARELDAATALEWQLATSVSNAPVVDANAKTQALVRLSGDSQRAIKSNLLRIRDGQRADDDATRTAFAAAFGSADFAEGAAAFLEKRPANF